MSEPDTYIDRDARILRLAPIVKRCALRAARTTSRLRRDDLTSIAWLAAISAVDDFDPARGVLEAFATLRISSALKREANRRGTYERRHAQITERYGAPFDVDKLSAREHSQTGAHHNDPADIVERYDTALRMRTAVYRLEPRRRALVNRHINEGESLTHAARALGVSPARAHQLKTSALVTLRTDLQVDDRIEGLSRDRRAQSVDGAGRNV